MLASLFVRPYTQQKTNVFERLANFINESSKKIYIPTLHWAMRNRIFVIGIGILSIFASWFLYNLLPKDLLPPDDTGFIEGYTQARDGTSPFLMQEYHEKLAKVGINDPCVESLLSISSSGNDNQGFLFFRLKPYRNRLSLDKVLHNLSETYRQIPGVNVYLSPLPLVDLAVGTTSQALYQYSLTSIDRKALTEAAKTLTQKIKQNPLFTAVSNDLLLTQPQWEFNILRDKASNYNLTPLAIEEYLGWAYSNNRISLINGELQQYDVIVETLPKFYSDPSVLSKLYIRSMNNALVPLSEVVVVKESIGPLTVNHMDGINSVNISFNPKSKVALGTVVEKLKNLAKDLPPQVAGQLIGTAKAFDDSFKSLNLLFLLAFFVIYVVLGILYENFIHPITVMSSLPPTLFGGLLTLHLFQESLTLYSFIGLILLMGIVLKNGIMLVDFASASIEKGASVFDAIIEASLTRFRPILMTTFSALMGALPIALGIGGSMAQNRIGLGLAVVGGLLFSQLITLLLIPVLYSLFEELREALKKKAKG